MSSRARIAILVGAVVVLVVAFVIASGSGDDNGNSTSDDTTPTAVAPADTTATDGAPAATTTTTTTTPPPAPAVPVVTVVNAKPQGGIQKLKFKKGDTIKFTVKSDTTDEIHFHGYDVHKDVTAGGSVTFSVKGTIEGIFVVELENHGTQIASVEVDPA